MGAGQIMWLGGGTEGGKGESELEEEEKKDSRRAERREMESGFGKC